MLNPPESYVKKHEQARKEFVTEVTKKKDGFFIKNYDGATRFMTFWESVNYRIFGVRPKF